MSGPLRRDLCIAITCRIAFLRAAWSVGLVAFFVVFAFGSNPTQKRDFEKYRRVLMKLAVKDCIFDQTFLDGSNERGNVANHKFGEGDAYRPAVCTWLAICNTRANLTSINRDLYEARRDYTPDPKNRDPRNSPDLVSYVKVLKRAAKSLRPLVVDLKPELMMIRDSYPALWNDLWLINYNCDMLLSGKLVPFQVYRFVR